MKQSIATLEAERVALQAKLDVQKTQADRNRMGQFATPSALANEILAYATRLLPRNHRVRFLDPALGTGAFYSALRHSLPAKRIGDALGFEIDQHYGYPASQLWHASGLEVRNADFTSAEPDARFNLVICNPPYVRHHHLRNGEKGRVQALSLAASGIKLGGLAGLYCHFMCMSHAWMEPGAVAGWLVPSEFMDVNYGQALKRYLLEKVTLVHIHRFDPNDVQFADALVSSAVVWFRNSPPPVGHSVRFTFGGLLSNPRVERIVSAAALAREPKWSRFPRQEVRSHAPSAKLSDYFAIKRGIATGDNSFFIVDQATITQHGLPANLFRPILPSPRHLETDEVPTDKNGIPQVERPLFLLDTKLSESEIRAKHPCLWDYLEVGRARGLHGRHLCSHRSPWYSQENRPPAPIVCTYLGRTNGKHGRPFRFILNESNATVANVYLAMYPKPALARLAAEQPGLMRKVWEALNTLTLEQLVGEGRVYGGGLYKLEPRELGNVDAAVFAGVLPAVVPLDPDAQLGFFNVPHYRAPRTDEETAA